MRALCLSLALAVCAGCGAAPSSFSASPAPLPFDGARAAGPTAAADPSNPSTTDSTDRAPAASTIAEVRRLTYEARVELVVDSLEEFARRLPQQVREFGGYLGDARSDRSPGMLPNGTWTVRVPVERYDAFLEAIGKTGSVLRMHQTSQDVTIEYVDLESRITNARRVEERIAKLIADSGGGLQEILLLERELARGREELERLEGRRRLLANRTSLSTVVLNVRERDPYLPNLAPEFDERLADAWSGSIGRLRRLAENLLLIAVASAPWMGVVGACCLPIGLLVRRALRTR